MSDKKKDKGYLRFQILLYTFIVITVFILQYATGVIPEENKKYGTTASNLNRYIRGKNSKIVTVIQLTNKKLEQLNPILFYTNDTTTKFNVNIAPNIEDRYVVKYNNDYRDLYNNKTPSSIVGIKDANLRLKEFVSKHNFLGFNLIYKDTINNTSFILKNVNDIETTTNYKTQVKYQIVHLFYYSDEVKKEKIKYINNNQYTTLKQKEEEIETLHKEQFSKIIITEKELKKEKDRYYFLDIIKGKPNIDTHKVINNRYYFSCYNKQLDKPVFKEKVKLFESIFIKNKRKNLEGIIKEKEAINLYN